MLDAALTEQQPAELAATFKLLADPVRLRLLSLVADEDADEVCACDLVRSLGRSQPTRDVAVELASAIPRRCRPTGRAGVMR